MADCAHSEGSHQRRTGSGAMAELSRRVALAREPAITDAKGPARRLFAAELSHLLEPIKRPFRSIRVTPAQQPKLVMLLPGFATHPVRMKYMAQQLEKAGHEVKRWGLGFNWGATAEKLEAVEKRLVAIHRDRGCTVVLVGWSLGGLFARELAKRHPDAVEKVITLGTPFSGDMRANNAWRIYQAVAGYSIDNPPVESAIADKPPVPTTAIWSPRDGVISPRSACGKPGERDRAIALRCSHIGFVQAKESIEAVLGELDAR